MYVFRNNSVSTPDFFAVEKLSNAVLIRSQNDLKNFFLKLLFDSWFWVRVGLRIFWVLLPSRSVSLYITIPSIALERAETSS